MVHLRDPSWYHTSAHEVRYQGNEYHDQDWKIPCGIGTFLRYWNNTSFGFQSNKLKLEPIHWSLNCKHAFVDWKTCIPARNSVSMSEPPPEQVAVARRAISRESVLFKAPGTVKSYGNLLALTILHRLIAIF